jgi:competence protein ComGC
MSVMGTLQQLHGYVQEIINERVPLLSVRNMYRAFTVLLLFTTISGNIGCSHKQQLRKEASLREALLVLRKEIEQFTLDLRRTPTSLSELVSAGYIRQIPTDPLTGRNDTWRVEKSDEYFKVHSGSDAISSEGTPYSSW